MSTIRRVSRQAKSGTSAAVFGFLQTGRYASARDARGQAEIFFKTVRGGDGLLADWTAVREALLAEWLRELPGTRPWGWWEFEAPRWAWADRPARVQPINVDVCNPAEPRRRVGGIGTPAYEVLNYWPRFDHGMPVDWVTPSDAEYYNGRARDVAGRPIGTEYRAGHFAGLAPRPDDPPTFESQAIYLDRHALLVASERDRLAPDAFRPEAIVIEAGGRR